MSDHMMEETVGHEGNMTTAQLYLGPNPSQSLVLYSENQCSIYLHVSITSFLVPFYAMSLASVKTKEISNKSVTKMTVSSRWWQAGILYVTRDGSRPAAQPIMLVYIGTTWWGLGAFWSHLRSSPVLLGLNMVDCQKYPHGPQFQEAAWISPALSFCRYSCNQYVTRTVNSEKNTKWWFFSFLISTNHLLPVNTLHNLLCSKSNKQNCKASVLDWIPAHDKEQIWSTRNSWEEHSVLALCFRSFLPKPTRISAKHQRGGKEKVK